MCVPKRRGKTYEDAPPVPPRSPQQSPLPAATPKLGSTQSTTPKPASTQQTSKIISKIISKQSSIMKSVVRKAPSTGSRSKKSDERPPSRVSKRSQKGKKASQISKKSTKDVHPASSQALPIKPSPKTPQREEKMKVSRVVEQKKRSKSGEKAPPRGYSAEQSCKSLTVTTTDFTVDSELHENAQAALTKADLKAMAKDTYFGDLDSEEEDENDTLAFVRFDVFGLLLPPIAKSNGQSIVKDQEEKEKAA